MCRFLLSNVVCEEEYFKGPEGTLPVAMRLFLPMSTTKLQHQLCCVGARVEVHDCRYTRLMLSYGHLEYVVYRLREHHKVVLENIYLYLNKYADWSRLNVWMLCMFAALSSKHKHIKFIERMSSLILIIMEMDSIFCISN